MPEASRSDAPLRDPLYPQGADREDALTDEATVRKVPGETSLPLGDIYSQLPPSRLESFGRNVGSAVGGVLRFPQTVGHATSRMRRAGNTRRAEASAALLEMMDNAALRAERLRSTTQEKLSDFSRTARIKTSRLEDQAAERWDQIRSSAKERLDVATRRAAQQWQHSRRAVVRFQQDDPVRFLAIVAGATFVIGAGLRIWRSNSND